MSVPKENTALKLANFVSFGAANGLLLSPLAFFGGSVVLRAAAYTGAIVGSLTWVGANAPSDQ